MWSHLKDKSIFLPKITWEKIDEQVKPVLRKMEKAGIKIDIKVFGELAKKVEKRLKILEKEIYKLSGEKFNINSPAQLAVILFEKLKLPTGDLKKTKTGISTAALELEKIASKHKIIKPILEYRELNKLLTTYLKPLPLLVDKNCRLHTSYGQDTSTGRLTSIEPNLQNIPTRGETGSEIRKAFIASSGMELISADYSQIELRVVACLGEDSLMIEAFRAGQDIHSHTASEIFNTPIDKVTPEQRRVAKTVNFGIVYGQSPYGLSQTLKIDQHIAAEYIKKYFETHKGIKKYIDNVIEKAHKEGYVETLFGFRRTLPNINSDQYGIASAEERMAINTPVQGTAAEILKLAMINLDNELSKLDNRQPTTDHSRPRMLLTVHDELVIESPKDKVREVAKIIKDVMENVIKLCVPITVDIKTGSNWGEMREIDD